MLSDELNIYDDLDQFEEVENKKSKELEALEAKYNAAQLEIVNLQAENKTLSKKIKTMEVNLQNLLDTAKAEIKRKDTQIAQLRREKDDICFRRKKPHHFGQSTVQLPPSAEIQQQLEQPKQQNKRFNRDESNLKSDNVFNSNNNCWNEKPTSLDKQQAVVPVTQREMSAERNHQDRQDFLNSEATNKPQRSADMRNTHNSNRVKEREKQRHRERDKDREHSRDRDRYRDRDKSRRRSRSRSRSRTRYRSRERDQSNAQRLSSKSKSLKTNRRSRSRSGSRSNHRTVIKSSTRNNSRESEKKQDEKSSPHERDHKRKIKDDFFGNTTEQLKSKKRTSEDKSCAHSETMFQAPKSNKEDNHTPKELQPLQNQEETTEEQLPERSINKYFESNASKTAQDVNQLKDCKYLFVDFVALDEKISLTKQPFPISNVDISIQLVDCVQNVAEPEAASSIKFIQNINMESQKDSTIELVNCVEKIAATNANNIKFKQDMNMESNENSSESQENKKMAGHQIPALLTSNTINIPGLDLINSESLATEPIPGLGTKQEGTTKQENKEESSENETPLNEVEEVMPILAVTPEKPLFDDEDDVDEILGATDKAEDEKLCDDEGLNVADKNTEGKMPFDEVTLTASNAVNDEYPDGVNSELAKSSLESPKSYGILTDDMPTPKRPERIMKTLQIIENTRLPVKIDIENIADKNTEGKMPIDEVTLTASNAVNDEYPDGVYSELAKSSLESPKSYGILTDDMPTPKRPERIMKTLQTIENTRLPVKIDIENIADKNTEGKMPIDEVTLTASNAVNDEYADGVDSELAKSSLESPKSYGILTDDMPTPKRPERIMKTLQIIENTRLPVKIDIENIADKNTEGKMPIDEVTLTASNAVNDEYPDGVNSELAKSTLESPKSYGILTDDMPTPKRPERIMETLQIIENIRLPVKIDIENMPVKVDACKNNRSVIEPKMELSSDVEASKHVAPVIEKILSINKQAERAGVVNTTSINPNSTAATVMYAQPDSTKIEDNDEDVAPETALNESPDTPDKVQDLSLETDTIEMTLKQLHQQWQTEDQPDETAVTSTSTKGGQTLKKDLMQVLMQSPLQQNLTLTQTPTSVRSSRRKKIGGRKFNERFEESSESVSNEESPDMRVRNPLKKRKLDLGNDSTVDADDSSVLPVSNVTIEETPLKKHKLGLGNDSTVDADDPSVLPVSNVTIEQTLSPSSKENNQSVNNSSTVTKRCSLGHSDYQFERINDEVVLRVTRRPRKRPASKALKNDERT